MGRGRGKAGQRRDAEGLQGALRWGLWAWELEGTRGQEALEWREGRKGAQEGGEGAARGNGVEGKARRGGTGEKEG